MRYYKIYTTPEVQVKAHKCLRSFIGEVGVYLMDERGEVVCEVPKGVQVREIQNYEMHV
jgi:hypothetical protein